MKITVHLSEPDVLLLKSEERPMACAVVIPTDGLDSETFLKRIKDAIDTLMHAP